MAGLVCKNRNCSQPIALPPATHPDMSQGLGSWPMDAAPRNFLCLGCKHIYEYSPRNVVDLPLDERPTLSRKRNLSVVCIELKCGAEACESQVRIYMLSASELEPDAAVPEYLRRA